VLWKTSAKPEANVLHLMYKRYENIIKKIIGDSCVSMMLYSFLLKYAKGGPLTKCCLFYPFLLKYAKGGPLTKRFYSFFLSDGDQLSTVSFDKLL